MRKIIIAPVPIPAGPRIDGIPVGRRLFLTFVLQRLSQSNAGPPFVFVDELDFLLFRARIVFVARSPLVHPAWR